MYICHLLVFRFSSWVGLAWGWWEVFNLVSEVELGLHREFMGNSNKDISSQQRTAQQN